MELKDINKLTDNMLANFINEIGLDGNYFVSNKTCPIIFSNILGEGDYISPKEQDKLNNIIKSLGNKIDDRAKNIIKNRGIIRINKIYKDIKNAIYDFYITVIHEKIHSHRNLLIYDAHLDDNQSSYLSNKNKFEQNNNNYEVFHVDASQEILKGSIDNSKNTIDKYKNKNLDELDDLEFADEKLNEQMYNQQIIDEALVELMAILSYKLYMNKQKGIESNIWNELEKLKNLDEMDEDIKYTCELILKHHDFELFYWMLDPITYQSGDIHYDFFSNYTKNDSDLVKKICNYDNFGIDDETIKLL